MNDDSIRKRVRALSAKLPDQAQDEYYSDSATRIDTLVGSAGVYYIRLRRVKSEYDRLAKAVPVRQGFLTFYDYVKEYYGIKMIMEGDEIGLNYTVIDERKHTLFLLKFGA